MFVPYLVSVLVNQALRPRMHVGEEQGDSSEIKNDLLSMSTEELIHDDTPSPSAGDLKPEEVLRMPSDLVTYRHRIDANTVEQRRNRDVIAALNEKLLEFRKKNAEATARLASSQTLPADIATLPEYGPLSVRASSCDMLPTSSSATLPQPLMSSTAIDSDLFSHEDIDQSLNHVLMQLEEEIERNEKIQDHNFALQDQVSGMVKANETMKDEISKMSMEVEKLKEERESERSSFMRQSEKKQSRLKAQQQALLSIRSSFNRLKRQVQDLRIDTGNDLDRQKTEFVRCASSMELALKQATLQFHNGNASKKDENSLDEMLKEYENLTSRYLQSVDENNEKNRKVTELEAVVRKTKEERDAAQESLRKIINMPELKEIHGRKSRSLSPSGRLTLDAIQFVLSAIRDQNDEIRQQKRMREEQKVVIEDLHDKLFRNEEVRKIAQKEISDAQKDLETLKREKDDMQREHRRAVDKTERLDVEKAQLLANTERLQKQIVSLNASHQATVEEILQKHSGECARFKKQFDDEKEELERDYSFKLERMQIELERVKGEKAAEKDALQTALSDGNVVRNRLKDRENELSTKHTQVNELKEDLQAFQQSVSALKAKNAELEQKLQLMQSDAVKNSQSFADLEIKKEALKEENDSFSSELRNLKTQFAEKNSTLKRLQDAHHDALEDAAELRKELSSLREKMAEDENERDKLLDEIKMLKQEKASVERRLTDKLEELSSCSSLAKQLEETQSLTAHELDLEREKLGNLETNLARLRAENERLSHDLFFANETIEKKTASNQRAMNEMLEKYRLAEKERSEVINEKRALAEEVSTLRDHLSTNEMGRAGLQKVLNESEAVRVELVKKLHRFEDCAKRALSVAKTQSSLNSRTVREAEDQLLLSMNATSPGDFHHLRGSSSWQNMISPHVSFDLSTTEGPPGQLDISSSVEITFKVLRERIEELESEKKALADVVSRLKSNYNSAEEARKEQTKKADVLQKQITELQEENRAMESRLASSRQLLVSQEENLRSKDQQQKTFKARLLSADLHARDKDAKIAALNDLIASLKGELLSLEDDKKELRETISLFELEHAKADSLQRQADDELLKYRTEFTALHNKKEELASRLEEAEKQVVISRKRCAELERTIKEYRDSIRDLKKDEDQWKKKIDLMAKREEEDLDRQQRIDRLQMDLEEYVLKYKATVKERDVLRNELQETKTQQNRCAQRVAELQQTVCALTSENNQLQQRLAVLEKTQKDGRSLGGLLHEELEQLRADKVACAAEKQELKRRIQKIESERREVEAQRARLERERVALKQHIETLEIEKQKNEAASKQTNIERLALDKSLSAMERENRELYKNCSQLQKQVSQLEKENGSHLLHESATQHRLLETQFQRMKNEKHDLQQRLEQSEQMYSEAVKALESKIAALNKQLEGERKRRREFVTRASANERDVEELRSGLDDSIASLQRLSAQSPNKSHKGSTTSVRSRSSMSSKGSSKK